LAILITVKRLLPSVGPLDDMAGQHQSRFSCDTRHKKSNLNKAGFANR
jgi:hypothetical protein